MYTMIQSFHKNRFAMFRKFSQIEVLINEYILSCTEFMKIQKEKRSVADDENILHTDQSRR